MEEYVFDVTIKLWDLGIEANSEEEARSKLTQQVSDYFADTQVTINKDDAVLVGCYEAETEVSGK